MDGFLSHQEFGCVFVLHQDSDVYRSIRLTFSRELTGQCSVYFAMITMLKERESCSSSDRYFHPCLLTRGLNLKGIGAVEFDERVESEKLLTTTNDLHADQFSYCIISL